MSIIEVDAERVRTAAVTAAGRAGELVTQTQVLTADLAALQDCWRGNAAAGFQEVLTEWDSVQKQVHVSLASIQEALHAAAMQYSEVEDQNRRLFMR